MGVSVGVSMSVGATAAIAYRTKQINQPNQFIKYTFAAVSMLNR